MQFVASAEGGREALVYTQLPGVAGEEDKGPLGHCGAPEKFGSG